MLSNRVATGITVIFLTGTLAIAPVVTATGVPKSTAAESLAVPPLPFASHNDPSLCGIPRPMGEGTTGLLDGHYRGRLVEPTVYLYDSHLRNAVTGEAPSGTPVEVLYFQSNPTLDYYLVRVRTATGSFDAWVPAPFLRHITTP